MSTIDNTAGAMFVGCILSALFFGATITQSVVYFQTCHPDVWFVKAVVIVTIILDILHTALVMHCSYIYVVGSIDHPARLSVLPWSLMALNFVTCAGIAVVRMVFIRRIWYLSNKNRLVTGISIALSLGSIVVDICFRCRHFLSSIMHPGSSTRQMAPISSRMSPS